MKAYVEKLKDSDSEISESDDSKRAISTSVKLEFKCGISASGDNSYSKDLN